MVFNTICYAYEFDGKKFNIYFTNPVKIKNNEVRIVIDKVTKRIINGYEFIVWYIDLFLNDDVTAVKVDEGLYNCITDGSREWPIGELSVKFNGIADSIKKVYVDIAEKIVTNDSRNNVDKKSRELVERVFEKIINTIDVITQ